MLELQILFMLVNAFLYEYGQSLFMRVFLRKSFKRLD